MMSTPALHPRAKLLVIPEPPEPHEPGILFLCAHEIIHSHLPILHYLARMQVVEYQDWDASSSSSDDNFPGAFDSDDSGDSNFNGYHPGLDGPSRLACLAHRPSVLVVAMARRLAAGRVLHSAPGSVPPRRPSSVTTCMHAGGTRSGWRFAGPPIRTRWRTRAEVTLVVMRGHGVVCADSARYARCRMSHPRGSKIEAPCRSCPCPRLFCT